MAAGKPAPVVRRYIRRCAHFYCLHRCKNQYNIILRIVNDFSQKIHIYLHFAGFLPIFWVKPPVFLKNSLIFSKNHRFSPLIFSFFSQCYKGGLLQGNTALPPDAFSSRIQADSPRRSSTGRGICATIIAKRFPAGIPPSRASPANKSNREGWSCYYVYPCS